MSFKELPNSLRRIILIRPLGNSGEVPTGTMVRRLRFSISLVLIAVIIIVADGPLSSIRAEFMVKQVTTTVDQLRIRKGPGEKTVMIGYLNIGQPVIVTKTSTTETVINGKRGVWYKIIDQEGHFGWVFGAYTTPTTPSLFNTVSEKVKREYLTQIFSELRGAANFSSISFGDMREVDLNGDGADDLVLCASWQGLKNDPEEWKSHYILGIIGDVPHILYRYSIAGSEEVSTQHMERIWNIQGDARKEIILRLTSVAGDGEGEEQVVLVPAKDRSDIYTPVADITSGGGGGELGSDYATTEISWTNLDNDNDVELVVMTQFGGTMVIEGKNAPAEYSLSSEERFDWLNGQLIQLGDPTISGKSYIDVNAGSNEVFSEPMMQGLLVEALHPLDTVNVLAVMQAKDQKWAKIETPKKQVGWIKARSLYLSGSCVSLNMQ